MVITYILSCTIFIILSIIIALFKPKIKGWFGETAVAAILAGLNKEEYKVINDVMLKTEYGSSQIDHIIVSIYGIFVIETKNYKGWITGNEYSDQWTKNMYGNKYKFRNPLKQNYGHVKALAMHLELKEDDFIPIVVFSVDSELKVKTNKPVIYTVNLNKEIKKYQDRKFTPDQVEYLTSKILELNINSRETRKEHVNNIRAEIIENKNKIENGICPRCGGTLVERSGKYGKFIGCSNYPKCRYTKN